MEFHGDGFWHWRQEIEKESTAVEGQISRSGVGDGVETEACSLVGNSGSDRQPMKMSAYWSDVNMWRCTDYKTGCTVLDSLKCANQGLRETSQERIAIRVHEKQQEFLWHHQ